MRAFALRLRVGRQALLGRRVLSCGPLLYSVAGQAAARQTQLLAALVAQAAVVLAAAAAVRVLRLEAAATAATASF